MANQKESNKSTERTKLLIGRDAFKLTLLKRVDLGQNLSLFKVCFPNETGTYTRPFYGRMGIDIEPTEEQRKWISDFNKWSDYNNELLKQAFDNPNNEYLQKYVKCGQHLYYSGNESLVQLYRDELKSKVEYLESLIEKISLLPANNNEQNKATRIHLNSNSVFIVHGHDTALRTEVELLIKILGYEPIVLFKQPNVGKTIIEKIELEANDLAYAIVLYTACDLGKDKQDIDKELNPRARQNVVFEHGYMCALLGRQNVCALVEHSVEIPGDLSGIVYVSYDSNGAWKLSIAKEMKAAGLEVDLNKLV